MLNNPLMPGLSSSASILDPMGYTQTSYLDIGTSGTSHRPSASLANQSSAIGEAGADLDPAGLSAARGDDLGDPEAWYGDAAGDAGIEQDGSEDLVDPVMADIQDATAISYANTQFDKTSPLGFQPSYYWSYGPIHISGAKRISVAKGKGDDQPDHNGYLSVSPGPGTHLVTIFARNGRTYLGFISIGSSFGMRFNFNGLPLGSWFRHLRSGRKEASHIHIASDQEANVMLAAVRWASKFGYYPRRVQAVMQANESAVKELPQLMRDYLAKAGAWRRSTGLMPALANVTIQSPVKQINQMTYLYQTFSGKFSAADFRNLKRIVPAAHRVLSERDFDFYDEAFLIKTNAEMFNIIDSMVRTQANARAAPKELVPGRRGQAPITASSAVLAGFLYGNHFRIGGNPWEGMTSRTGQLLQYGWKQMQRYMRQRLVALTTTLTGRHAAHMKSAVKAALGAFGLHPVRLFESGEVAADNSPESRQLRDVFRNYPVQFMRNNLLPPNDRVADYVNALNMVTATNVRTLAVQYVAGGARQAWRRALDEFNADLPGVGFNRRFRSFAVNLNRLLFLPNVLADTHGGVNRVREFFLTPIMVGGVTHEEVFWGVIRDYNRHGYFNHFVDGLRNLFDGRGPGRERPRFAGWEELYEQGGVTRRRTITVEDLAHLIHRLLYGVTARKRNNFDLNVQPNDTDDGRSKDPHDYALWNPTNMHGAAVSGAFIVSTSDVRP